MSDVAHPRRPVPAGRRLLASALVVAPLILLWFAWLDRAGRPDIRPALAALVAIGVIGGVVARSWWAILLVPVTSVGLLYLGRAINCAQGCLPAPDSTPLVDLWIQLLYAGLPAALGAAIGTPLGKRLWHSH